MYICKFCNREFKNAGGFATHEPYCKLNPDKIQRQRSPNAGAKLGSVPWNKGLSGDARCKHKEETKIKLKGSAGVARTPDAELERRRKISEKCKGKTGGYRQGSGRGKKGWYKGFFCDSSYELAYVIYCIDHGIPIVRNTEYRTYVHNGEIKNYLPDFIVNRKLVEIKGYRTDQWEAKLNSNPDITVLYENDLIYIFEYVKSVYGKGFIKLYE
jgi:hypothetical protein